MLAILDPGSERDQYFIRLDPDSDESCGIQFNICGLETLELWASVEFSSSDPQTFHPEWRAAWIASAFARNQTQSNLVEQVRILARLCPDGLETGNLGGFPWQIAACIDLRRTGTAWDEIVDKVAAGSLGDETDWELWGGSKERGITFAQLRIAAQWGVSDDYRGLIFRHASWTYYEDTSKYTLGNALRYALNRWPELRDSDALLHVGCHGFYRRVLHSSIPLHDSIDQFASTCIRNRVTFTNTLIAAALMTKSAADKNVELLAKLGAYVAETGRISSGWLADWETDALDFADEGASIIMNYPMTQEEAADVLCALSFLPPIPCREPLQEIDLVHMRTLGPVYRWAADALELNSLHWNGQEAAELAIRALGEDSLRDESLTDLLDAVELRGKTGPQVENFLIELLRRDALPSNWPRRDIGRLLVKLVERRPSITHLPDPAEVVVRIREGRTRSSNRSNRN